LHRLNIFVHRLRRDHRRIVSRGHTLAHFFALLREAAQHWSLYGLALIAALTATD
jgi:hypothetical protein